MRYNQIGVTAPMGIPSSMDTPGAGYGRCSACNEIKYVMADGTVAAHNQYHSEGTSVAVVRCPGSGREPLDAKGGDHPIVTLTSRPTPTRARHG